MDASAFLASSPPSSIVGLIPLFTCHGVLLTGGGGAICCRVLRAEIDKTLLEHDEGLPAIWQKVQT